MDALRNISTRVTPQNERADSRQTANNAGGYTFTITPEQRLHRFLTLGVEGGTFYVSESALSKDNAAVVVVEYATGDTHYLIDRVVDVSVNGRAPRQNPALFALAAAVGLGDLDGRRYALSQLPTVARTGTHLFLFAGYVENFRGWGRGLRRGIADWYLDKSVDQLAYQLIKYRQREGWSHRDLLRLAHPEGAIAPERARLFDWACGREANTLGIPLLGGYLSTQSADIKALPAIIREHRLSWEMLPTEALNSKDVWAALLDNGLPQTALMRQLPRLTNLGLLRESYYRNLIVTQLTDSAHLRKARVHPINVLVAARTYASGQSARGSSTWCPDRRIVDALDAAFYASFANVVPCGKRMMLALDVSESMSSSPIANMPITARGASAALALITAATEQDCETIAFTSGDRDRSLTHMSVVTPLSISPRQRLDDVINTVSGLPFGRTDCALPMLYALEEGIGVDCFVVYTDSETYAGDIHPHQALRQYREKVNPAAKLVVVGMTSTGFSIADPTDAGMLDIAGFDAAVPSIIADFARG